MEQQIKRLVPLPVSDLRLSQKRVAAYARVSSGKDAMLHSLAAQVSYFSGMIQKHSGWRYCGVYADEALTGTKSERPEFQRMLADCRAGKLDMVIVKSISRFARNTVTLLETVRELKQLDVDVYFEEQSIHSMSGDGELMLTILASYAQEESRSVSENCKWRIRARMKAGEIVGLRRMYGFTIHKNDIEIQPEQAAVVRRIFSDYLSGQSTIQIAKALQAEQVPTLLGGIWTDKRVCMILRNEKYAGNALLQKKYTVDHITKRESLNHGELPKYFAEGTHEGIIDAATFNRAQEILSQRHQQNLPKKPTTSRYPFSGKIRCGNCGGIYRRRSCHGKVSWQCATFLFSGKESCAAKQVPEETLFQTTASVLDVAEFDADLFARRIEGITVTGANRLCFTFHDGHVVEVEWPDRSRRDSWTPEMRERARAYAMKRWKGCQ